MSTAEQPLAELVGAPARGRMFEQAIRPALADAAASGRVRLDALARWLQDVAYDDINDAGLAGRSAGVVRTTRLAVARFPRFGERVACRTFCSGLGRMWAERRTTVIREGSPHPDVEAVALWIHMDLNGGRPLVLDERALAVFLPSTGGRRVRARLRHAPPARTRMHVRGDFGAPRSIWPVTSTTPPSGSRSRTSCCPGQSHRPSTPRSSFAPPASPVTRSFSARVITAGSPAPKRTATCTPQRCC